MELQIDPESIFFEKDMFQNILPDYVTAFFDLKNSRPISKYDLSFREILGLAVIVLFRKFREPDKEWLFSTDKEVNDDGFIGSFEVKSEKVKINYCEKVEQVYLPEYFKRKKCEKYNDYLVRFLHEKKLSKGDNYKKDKTLFILNDVKSEDAFYWQDFSKEMFLSNKIGFLHIYFLGLEEITESHIKYHLFSFTNQKYRQFLNGQFSLYIFNDGSCKFEIVQEINLLKNKKPR